MKIAISSDSTCAISQAKAKKLGIYILPLNVIVDGHEYHDDITINQVELNNMMRRGSKIQTSTPTPYEIESYFDKMVESCYIDQSNIIKIIPSTLEGCVVRVSDIIAYLGKDRQDAERAGLLDSSNEIGDVGIGTINSDIMNNLMVNIIENSYGKPYIKMDTGHFEALKKAKSDNYELIYKNDIVKERCSLWK